MQATFETEKNKKALIYTVIICIILLLLAILIRWTIAQPPIPGIQDLIEVNLGNDMEGYGKEQPLIKGEMSSRNPVEEVRQKSSAAKEEASQDIEADQNNDKDAAPVVKPEKPNPKATTITKNPIANRRENNNPTPAIRPTPKERAPQAIYKGGGNGKGNGATTDNGYRYQGNNPNGHGDAGTPTGKADSYGDSPGGKSGVGISSGLTGRSIIGWPSFEDDFNENAKVYVAVNVDATGHVTSASIVDRGTTTTNPNIRSIAIQKAKLLKFNTGEEDHGTIIFNFKVHN